ncbi:MAG: hypothetical protein ACTSRU_18005 [Candidatus Hodarchaeales archaeon]
MSRVGYKIPKNISRVKQGHVYRSRHHLWDVMQNTDDSWCASIWSERLDSLHAKGKGVEPVIDFKNGFNTKKDAIIWARSWRFNKAMRNYIISQANDAGPPWIIGG